MAHTGNHQATLSAANLLRHLRRSAINHNGRTQINHQVESPLHALLHQSRNSSERRHRHLRRHKPVTRLRALIRLIHERRERRNELLISLRLTQRSRITGQHQVVNRRIHERNRIVQTLHRVLRSARRTLGDRHVLRGSGLGRRNESALLLIVIEGDLAAKISARRSRGRHLRGIRISVLGGGRRTTAGNQQGAQRHACNARTGVTQSRTAADAGSGTIRKPRGQREKRHGVPFE